MDILYSTQFSIPLLQVVLLLALSTIALLFGRIKLALFVHYCFALYWGYIQNLNFFTGSGTFKLDGFTLAYFGFGLVIIIFAMIGLFFHHD